MKRDDTTRVYGCVKGSVKKKGFYVRSIGVFRVSDNDRVARGNVREVVARAFVSNANDVGGHPL